MGLLDCCCCCGDPNSPSLKHQGVVEKRRPRDVCWLLLFGAFWIGMFVVCGVGFSKGSLARLVSGYDSYGFLCGTDNSEEFGDASGPDLTDRKKLYYLNALELLNPMNLHAAKRICVEKCPSVEDVCDIVTTQGICTVAGHFRCPYYRVAERGLYDDLDGVEDWNTTYYAALITAADSGCTDTFAAANLPDFDAGDNVCGQSYQAESMVPGRGPCYAVYTETVEYFNRCFPKFTEELQAALEAESGDASSFSAVKEEFGDTSERVQRYVADITKGWIIIVVGGLCTSVVVAMVWLVILRYFAGVMAWTTVLLVNAAFAGCTIFALARSGQLGEMGEVGASLSEKIPKDEDPTEDERQIWHAIWIVGAVLTGLLLLLTLVMIKRIRIAVAIIKVACQAISTMPTLLFFPLIPFVLEVGLVLYFVFVSAMLYSAGDLVPKYRETPDEPAFVFSLDGTDDLETATEPEPLSADISREDCAAHPDCYYSVEWNSDLKYMFLYHLFGLLWTNQFIIGFGYVAIAGAVASFYWSRADPKSQNFNPVSRSVCNTLKYHLGSIAFGSFIVAIVQFVRLVLEYVDRKSKKLQESGNAGLKYCMRCLKCCLWILEKIIKFINRNAYIMVAVKGTGYCQSAARAVTLLISNALRLVAVNVIGDVLLWLGKLAVTASCGLVAFLMSDSEYYTNEEEYPDSYLSSPLMPVVISMLVGYAVADLFFEVFEMTIDTVLLSFCEDCETHGGDPVYAPPLLMTAIGQSKQFHDRKMNAKAPEN